METQETGKEKRLTRKERVFHQLSELTCKVTLDDIRSVLGSGFEAGVIGGALGITPNNTCMELGALLKEERVVKILGRPVYFFAREELEQSLGIRFSQCIFKNYGEFRDTVDRLLRSVSDGRTSPKLPPVSIDPTGSFSRLVGSRESLRPNIDQARAAILYPPSGLHCLITGQTGVGKSHFAEAMYDFAVEQGVIARDAAFVIYNCANYFENPQLLLSQLFGYKKGAFTGADRDTPGVVDQADGGILFLDEAHRLSPEGQEKMFLLIDKGIYQRLGETKEYHHARLRIIAATTEDPGAASAPQSGGAGRERARELHHEFSLAGVGQCGLSPAGPPGGHPGAVHVQVPQQHRPAPVRREAPLRLRLPLPRHGHPGPGRGGHHPGALPPAKAGGGGPL